MQCTVRSILLILSLLLSYRNSTAQHVKLRCSEKKLKNVNGTDPILVNTCYIKNFKFVETSVPDYVGRYFDSGHEVYVLTNGKYHKTVNSNVFNKDQGQLVTIINERIQKEYKNDLADSTISDCLDGLDSIPTYKMNDFEISFNRDKIWFEVHLGLSSACRAVDGSIVTFKITEVEKYFK